MMLFLQINDQLRKCHAFFQLLPRSTGKLISSKRSQANAAVDFGEIRLDPSNRTNIMKLISIFKAFKKDESGAVTVDWVVLTAAIVGLGMVVMTSVGGSITGLATEIATDLDTRNAGYENQ
jgi:Flp pilus assembly pilin Flp